MSDKRLASGYGREATFRKSLIFYADQKHMLTSKIRRHSCLVMRDLIFNVDLKGTCRRKLGANLCQFRQQETTNGIVAM